MKKTLIVITLGAGLLIGGGTGFYYVSAQDSEGITHDKMMMDKMVNSDFEMVEMMHKDMESMMNVKTMNFGQMKEHMMNMHPGLSVQQLEKHYKDMHGTGGSENSKNFQ
ncbi:hypothetical protein M3175_22570 [Robertmurraya korlensis]|nr:hypothetical protein [Robertmurraya korlensis]